MHASGSVMMRRPRYGGRFMRASALHRKCSIMINRRPEPIIIDGCGHRHYRQEFHFEGQGFFGRIHAAILNWLRRNSD